MRPTQVIKIPSRLFHVLCSLSLALLGTYGQDAAAVEGPPGVVAGEWLASVHGQYTWEAFDNGEDQYGGIGFGIGYQFTRRIGLIFHGIGHQTNNGDQASGGAEAQLTCRGNLWITKPAVLFIEGGAGIINSPERIPASGSRFNFTEHLGLGVLVPLHERTSFTCGVRYQHLSNAGFFDDGNPGIDGLTGFATILFSL